MSNWQTHGSILSYPYGWQTPAKTEQWVFEILLEKKINTPYVEYIAFPWATLIDLLDRGFLEQAEIYIQALQKLPIKKSTIRVTACQHINPKCIMELLAKIKITDLFWAHKIKQQDLLGSMRLYPLALYPVAFANISSNKIKSLNDRKYLFSFVGAYDPGCYISDIREKILKIEPLSDVFIKRRDQWHFEDAVYGKNGLNDKDAQCVKNKETENLIEYIEVLSETRYSLCPSGSGPNSIRFWESFVFGSIPILFSEDLEVPPLDLKYISMGDDDIENIHYKLSNINSSEYINTNLDRSYSDIFLGNIMSFMRQWS